jgi:hypothetical protein
MEPREISCRIRVIEPPAGVEFRLQRGKADLVPPVQAGAGELVFELTLRVGRGRDGGLSLLGPFAQGPPDARFVYVNSGTMAGQPGSCWTRRAKVPLKGITPAMVAELGATGAVAEARIAGRARDGGPACATVPLLDGGWHMASTADSP